LKLLAGFETQGIVDETNSTSRLMWLASLYNFTYLTEGTRPRKTCSSLLTDLLKMEEIPFVGISTRERPFIEAEAPDPTESEELRTPFQKQKLRDSSPLPFFWKAVLGTLNARSTSLMTDP
ncbi:hypothetical protein CUMW_257890, partial [Citrus unshiu]